MKKFIRVAIVLCMMLSLAVTAFAAPDLSDSDEIDIKVTDANGNVIEDIEFDESEVPIFDIEIDDDDDFIFDDGSSAKVKDLSVVFHQDIHVPKEKLPVTITFTVEGADADDVLHVMHHNGQKWERVGHGTGSSINVTFTSLSPVAVLLEHVTGTTTAPGTTTDTGTTPATGTTLPTLTYTPSTSVTPEAPAATVGADVTTGTSPKTGEQPVVMAAAVIALLAGAVAVVTLKKKEEN